MHTATGVAVNQTVTVQEIGGFIIPTPVSPAPSEATDLFADTCGQSLTVNWDLDDDGAYDDGTGTLVQYSWPAEGDYPVSIEVTDGITTVYSDRIVRVRQSGGAPGPVGNTLKCVKNGTNVDLIWELPDPFPEWSGERWDNVRESLKELSKVAEDQGVILALQNHEPVTRNEDDVLKLIEEESAW